MKPALLLLASALALAALALTPPASAAPTCVPASVGPTYAGACIYFDSTGPQPLQPCTQFDPGCICVASLCYEVVVDAPTIACVFEGTHPNPPTTVCV